MASDMCEVCGAELAFPGAKSGNAYITTTDGTYICSFHLKTGEVRFKRDENGELVKGVCNGE